MSKIPFDIKYRPQIESGEYTLETRDGNRARIICWDKNGFKCKEIVALVTRSATGVESCNIYTTDGLIPYRENMDLFIVTPEEELNVFEEGLNAFLFDFVHTTVDEDPIDYVKKNSGVLLSFARQKLIKDGYVIEKKAFYDAVKKVDPEVMKEVSETIDNIELTEFERRIKDLLAIKCEIFYNEDIGGCYDLKGLCRVILECAREQLKPDINSMLESNYKTAYKEGYDEGRTDALRDLPKWKEIGQGNNYSSETKFCINGRYLEMNDTLNRLYEISLKDLEKLPKEEEK